MFSVLDLLSSTIRNRQKIILIICTKSLRQTPFKKKRSKPSHRTIHKHASQTLCVRFRIARSQQWDPGELGVSRKRNTWPQSRMARKCSPGGKRLRRSNSFLPLKTESRRRNLSATEKTPLNGKANIRTHKHTYTKLV